MNLKPNGRIWIDTEQGAFMGYGRIELLEKIQTTGSLRKAALEMKMSYQQAWKLITQMNERAGEPLVTLKRGGKNGGLTQLTPFGEKAIIAFKDFNVAFQQFLANYTTEIKNNL
jgi:molybdate transport system regulatory protein